MATVDNKKSLTDFLIIANSVCMTTNKDEIFRSCRITAKDNQFSVLTTNLTTWIKRSFQCWGDTNPFDRLVNCADLLKIVKSCKGVIEFLYNAETGFVSVNGVKIRTQDPETFPVLGTLAPSQWASVKGSDLLTAFDYVGKSISTDETRIRLNSVKMELSGNSGKLISTDGSRLTLYDNVPLISNDLALEHLMIDRVTILTLSKVLKKDSKCTVKFGTFQDKILFLTDSAAIVGINNDYRFPPYEKVIPNTYDYRIEVNGSELSELLKETRVIKNPGYNHGVMLELKPLENVIQVTCESEDKEMVVSRSIHCHYVRENGLLTIGFNRELLIDALCYHNKSVYLDFNEVLDPVVVRDPEAPSLTVIMPLRM